jgi:hypothetical protein
LLRHEVLQPQGKRLQRFEGRINAAPLAKVRVHVQRTESAFARAAPTPDWVRVLAPNLHAA